MSADPDHAVLLPTANGRETWAAVRGLLRGRRLMAGGALAVLVAATSAGLLTAPLLGRIVDLVADGRPASALTTPVVLLVVVAVVQGGLTALGVSMVAGLGEEMLARLRERFVARALRLPLERVERAGSGDLSARVTADVAIVAEAVRRAFPQLARSGLTIVLTLAGLAVLDWRFLLAALLAVPVQAHTVRWYVRRAVPLYAAQRVSVGEQQQQLLDTVGGAATVRAFRLGDRHVDLVTERSTATVGLALRGVRLITSFFGRLNLAEYIGLSAVLVTGFVLVRADAATIGTATAAALYFHNLFGPINTTLSLVDDAQVAAAGLARLVGVASLPATPRTTAPEVVGASVKAAGLGHAYVPGHPVLRDVDLHIEPGERVALVGASGAGKTTVAKLVAGIHTPTSGTVHLGGVRLEELGQSATGGTVALITQEVHVFAGRLDDDLRLARPDATEEELRAALDRVGALGWAEALPAGLATVVGEGGHPLTVTQAQQLALARLVLADPPIAVLDEATADAGSAGARVLEQAATAALEGRTGLVVAHRLTQAATADRVVVLEAGRVVESGTHDELVAAGGRYAALWAAWSTTRP
ncbi:ABC transporter ATP-binding protein [Phytohabitans kaempferiae]|uniref:ABC transporter ATP-binding protein n=1 Tax=Phytohabitans kaempferiae TaxID=1620943 RepID=A0ABV6MDI0_9ACTN